MDRSRGHRRPVQPAITPDIMPLLLSLVHTRSPCTHTCRRALFLAGHYVLHHPLLLLPLSRVRARWWVSRIQSDSFATHIAGKILFTDRCGRRLSKFSQKANPRKILSRLRNLTDFFFRVAKYLIEIVLVICGTCSNFGEESPRFDIISDSPRNNGRPRIDGYRTAAVQCFK